MIKLWKLKNLIIIKKVNIVFIFINKFIKNLYIILFEKKYIIK